MTPKVTVTVPPPVTLTNTDGDTIRDTDGSCVGYVVSYRWLWTLTHHTILADGKPLPDGWRIAGLYVEGAGTIKVSPGDRVTDNDIERSDAIIVSYTSRTTGTTVHRTIHGASSKQGVGDIIRLVTRVVSPIR